MKEKSIIITSEKDDNTKIDERVLTIFRYYIVLGIIYAFSWLFERYATNQFISKEILDILALTAFIGAILPPVGYLLLKLLRGLKIVQIGDFVKRSRGRLKKLLLKSGLLVAGESIKVEYKQDEYICTLAIPKTNNIDLETVQRHQNQFRDALRTEISNIYDDYQHFYIEYVVKQYIPTVADIHKYDIYPDKILYGFTTDRKPLYWDYIVSPNGLLCAPNGQGKTTFFNILMQSMKNKAITVTLVDGKKIEMNHYKDEYKVISDNYLEAIQAHEQLMRDRYVQMQEAEVRHFTELGLNSEIMFIDEYASVLDDLEPNKQGKMKTIIDNIARLGRSAGVEVIIILQQPHSRFISTELRENCHFKAILGIASDSMYNMLFDLETRTLPKVKIGNGYVQLGGKIKRFLFPNYQLDKEKSQSENNCLDDNRVC